MGIVSVNVGLPRRVDWNGEGVLTGIFKAPVAGRVGVRRLNLDGDRQADLSAHGGPDKAVYAYPAEHYGFWREQLSGMELPWAQFGENLTVEGLLEDEVSIGDRFRVGSAELEVSQPRIPCYKLGIRFGRDDMVQRFLDSRRTGFYFRVLQEGEVQAGDPIVVLERARDSLTVREVVELYVSGRGDRRRRERAAELEALPASWRERFRRQAERAMNRDARELGS